MKPQIIEKLRKELKEIKTEAQVVYILTRIYKILEIDKKKSNYPFLCFYRHWCVHHHLTKTDEIREEILEFIKNKENRDIFDRSLIKELNDFLEEYSLPTITSKSIQGFISLLHQVISDNPVTIKIDNYNYVFRFSNIIQGNRTDQLSVDFTIYISEEID